MIKIKDELSQFVTEKKKTTFYFTFTFHPEKNTHLLNLDGWMVNRTGNIKKKHYCEIKILFLPVLYFQLFLK